MFDDVEKFVELFKKNPCKAIVFLILIIVFIIGASVLQSYLGKWWNKSFDDNINQKTEGNQSPAIVTHGDVKIEYGGQK